MLQSKGRSRATVYSRRVFSVKLCEFCQKIIDKKYAEKHDGKCEQCFYGVQNVDV